MRRIGCEDLAGDDPVEQHADGREVLLDGRLLEVLAEAADIGGWPVQVAELLVRPGSERRSASQCFEAETCHSLAFARERQCRGKTRKCKFTV